MKFLSFVPLLLLTASAIIGGEKKGADPYATVFGFPPKITLGDEQKAKLEDLRKTYT